jgi:hypothetical protein
MLAELLLRLATPSGRYRPLGFVADSVALWSRATRRRRDWAPHEARSQELVREALEGLERRRTVIVLGSGLCRDVPLDELASRFERVILVDAVHLAPVRRRTRRLANVSFVTMDLTGAGDWLLGGAEERGDPLRPFIEDPDVDLVVSANLLSQLPLALERFVERAGPTRLPADLADRSIGWHLADLARFGARVCLLTDVECRDVEASDWGRRHAPTGREPAILARLDLTRGHLLPPPDATWTWTVAPPGEVERNIALIHLVHGYRDLAAAWGRSRSVPPAEPEGAGIR